jgi:WD40 repeat protein
MRALFVLKAHVSTVTDLVFSGDDRRLVSSGAGGAVYFWDMSTGARLMELEYVDKQCVYYTGGCSSWGKCRVWACWLAC